MWRCSSLQLGHSWQPLCSRQAARKFQTCSSQLSKNEPLRILFCGSDPFSIESLKAVHQYSRNSDSNILSIDVVTKKPKRTGRGLKTLTYPPITAAAVELGLEVHQIDTFTGWSPPQRNYHDVPDINLVIAVSFGLFVPPRILNGSKYGGLNVHPSMLPDLPGAAPIQWTIMKGYTRTGVTVQTLHPAKFDEGLILAQTESPGLDIPDHESITYEGLRDYLAPIGAEMLVRTIREQRFILPAACSTQVSGEAPVSKAPRVTMRDRAVDFEHMDLSTILRRNRAIPQLWTITTKSGNASPEIRIKLGTDLREASKEELFAENAEQWSHIPPGIPFTISDKKNVNLSQGPLYVKTPCGRYLAIPTITIAGSPPGPAAAASGRAGLFRSKSSTSANNIYVFQEGLRYTETEA